MHMYSDVIWNFVQR